jgi:DNA-3-methyladenine glycosylase
MILPRSFFARETVLVAQELLGKLLVHESPEGTTIGRIVETEAYLGRLDPAAHAYKGERPRTRDLFKSPGTIYVYFTYGMHYCCNVVTNRTGLGEAVLLRAVEPISGIELMRKRRPVNSDTQLTNGPAKLVQAFGISMNQSGEDATSSPLHFSAPTAQLQHLPNEEIVTTTRVGISKAKDQLLRYYIKNNRYVSKIT